MARKQTLCSGFRDVFWMSAWAINFILAWNLAAPYIPGLPRPDFRADEPTEQQTEQDEQWQSEESPQSPSQPNSLSEELGEGQSESSTEQPQRRLQRGPR